MNAYKQSRFISEKYAFWCSSKILSFSRLIQSKKENPLLPGFSFLSLYEKSMIINIEKILFVIYSLPGFYKK